jgi:hypothetical protein
MMLAVTMIKTKHAPLAIIDTVNVDNCSLLSSVIIDFVSVGDDSVSVVSVGVVSVGDDPVEDPVQSVGNDIVVESTGDDRVGDDRDD